MMELVKLSTPSGMILWARLSGQWGAGAFDRLAARIAGLALPGGSQVVLDFSAIDHLDYRAVPRLIHLAESVLARQEELRVVGFSAYLRRIVDFGGALDGREFLERHAPATGGGGPAPRGRAAACSEAEPVNVWARSLSAAPADRPRRPSRLRRLGLRRVSLQAFASLTAPSVN